MRCMADRKELLFTMLAAIALGAAVVAFALETYYRPSALFAPLRRGACGAWGSHFRPVASDAN